MRNITPWPGGFITNMIEELATKATLISNNNKIPPISVG